MPKNVGRAKTVNTGYSILDILQLELGRTYSAPELARRIGVDRKTIFRHIDELAMRFPIEVVSGKHGGFRLHKAFVTNGKLFFSHELEAIRYVVSKSKCLPEEVKQSILLKLPATRRET